MTRRVLEANPGSQEHFVSSQAYEVLYHGTRGPGKTMALLLSFLSQVDKGHEETYTGIIFRRRYKELYDMQINFTEKLSSIYGKKLQYSKKGFFKLPTGESLRLAHAEHDDHYWNFHGQQYAFLGFDELTSWKNLNLYEKLKSICRSANPDIQTRVRATTNSLGPGHSAVKQYFRIDEVNPGIIFEDDGTTRMHVWGEISENKHIITDKNYLRYLASSRNPNILKSWFLGSWNILAGGALSDVWRPEHQIVRPFKIPKTWSVYRTCDWGSARPFCVHHIAISDGSNYLDARGKSIETRNKDYFVINEVYGDGGEFNVGTKETPREVCKRVLREEKRLKDQFGVQKIYAGAADSSMWSVTGERSVAELLKPLSFVPAKKTENSRVVGLEHFRNRLLDACPDKYGRREGSGIFFFSGLKHTLRTLPELPRDEKNPEDVDTESEDHAYDSLRYFIHSRGAIVRILKPRL